MARLLWPMALALLLAALGCEPAAPPAAPAAPAAPVAAAEGGMCPEHRVLEVVCTRCHPQLIPVFQAKGDWCETHEFPESFCPLCHPERGGRPAVDVKDDGAPADGTKVRLKTPEIAAHMGLQTATAQEASALEAGISCPARLDFDAARVASVGASAAGVLRQIDADVGQRVRRGDVLARLESADVGASRARIDAARGRVEVARRAVARATTLQETGVVSLKEVEEAAQALAEAEAEEGALQRGLAVVGPSGEAPADVLGWVAVTAPLDGVVTRRLAAVGAYVTAGAPLFEVVDASVLWAELALPEDALAQVAVGRPVRLRFPVLGAEEVEGVLSYIAPEIDPQTRAATGRVRVPNPDGRLKAHMYGVGRVAAGGEGAVALVPREAVQRAKGVSLVFVRLNAGVFEARRVQVGASDGPLVPILAGIRPGEEVVTTGSFLLKTETLKGSIGAGCCAGE